LMMSLWDALRMNMMISYQELVRTFPNNNKGEWFMIIHFNTPGEFLLPCRQGWTENTRRN
ncbi:hypothetical protein V7O29_21095, partial [Escherichia coli]